MFYRKLELSSVFGPPEREGLHIPESECTALVMVLLERQILNLIVPSKICLLDLSKQKGSNRSCSGTEKGRPPCPGPQTQIAGEKERGSEKKGSLRLLFLVHISEGLISVWLLHSSKFQTTPALCFQLLPPTTNTLPPYQTQTLLTLSAVHTWRKSLWEYYDSVLEFLLILDLIFPPISADTV